MARVVRVYAAMDIPVPEQPEDSFRVVLNITTRQPRIDTVLLQALREQDRNDDLRNISRTAFKDLFANKRILIKGQSAKPSSAVAVGTTYVDILGYE